MSPPVLKRQAPHDDETHKRLKALIEVPTTSYLWVPEHAITFVPPVLSTIYGDGRALFTLTTINDRPAYWVIRGDSRWQTDDPGAPDDAPEFIDFVDDILTDLEEEFGDVRCSYSGSSLRWPASERIAWCQCEDCSDPDYVTKWPSVDGQGGCSWARLNWPSEIGTTDHPWTWRGNLLASDEDKAFSPAYPRSANYWLRRDIEALTKGRP